MINRYSLITSLWCMLSALYANASSLERDTLFFGINAEWNKETPLNDEYITYGVGSIELISDKSNAKLTVKWKEQEKSFDLERDVTIFNHSGLMLRFIQKGYDEVWRTANLTMKNYFSLCLDEFTGGDYNRNEEKRYPGFGALSLGGTKEALSWSKVYFLSTKPLIAGAELIVDIMAESSKERVDSFVELVISGQHSYFRVKEVRGKPLPVYKGKLTVISSPVGADVFLGDSLLGRTPLMTEDIPIGKYQLSVKKDFYKPYTESIVISRQTPISRIYEMESSIPISVNSNAYSAYIYLNGKNKNLPLNDSIPKGTYQIVVPRQFNSWSNVGWCSKKKTITVDENHTDYYIKLVRDNNYDEATFVGVDYDTSLKAVGLDLGANPAKHFMFELNFLWGLQKSEPIYWTGMKTATLKNYDLQKFQYSHWAVDLRMGPSLWCGPFLRIAPELGIQYLHLREYEAGEKNTKDEMFTGAYFSGLASCRFRFSLSSHLGIHVTPEYRINISGKKMLPDVSNDINSWVNGASIKAGLLYFFY